MSWIKTAEAEAKVTTEFVISVADVADGGQDSEASFHAAEMDEASVRKEAQQELKRVLKGDASKIKISEIDFVEFDSGNASHAGAYFNTTLTGPRELLVRFMMDYAETSKEEAESWIEGSSEDQKPKRIKKKSSSNPKLDSVAGPQMSRKPGAWSEIPTLKPDMKLADAIAAAGLPVLSQDELEVSEPWDYFRAAGQKDLKEATTPQWFILEGMDGHHYLVNTEGYNYARYVGRIDEQFYDAYIAEGR